MPDSQPNPDGFANKKKDVIVRFRDAYGPALADARVSAEHTATLGFQKLVGDHMEDMKARRRAIAASLHKIATWIEDYGPDDGVEKDIQDEKKLVVELVAESSTFFAQVLKPIQAPVEECERIITNHMNEAERDERSAPLHNAGLVELLKDEIALVPKAMYDRDKHLVIIKEPA